ncbi:MAG: hypothetical protein JKY20_06020 [Alphaproteobacteria bacterium]|nr:hypothetical protein [Alphaproteobacteria bacterium]
MHKWLPEPVAFAAGMLFLLIAGLAFALYMPEVRIWLETAPVGLAAMIGSLAGVTLILMAWLMGRSVKAERKRARRRERYVEKDRALAAAISGELTALANWSETLSTYLRDTGTTDDVEAWTVPAGSPARPVFENNTRRLGVLGKPLSESIAYAYAYLEQALYERDLPPRGGNDVGVRRRRLLNASATAGIVARHLSAFAVGDPIPDDLAGTLHTLYEKPALPNSENPTLSD